MGRYGHHNRYSRYSQHDNSQQDNPKKYKITKDYDVSTPEQARNEQENDSEYPQPTVIDRLKEKYQNYTSPEAKMERKQKKFEKRKEKMEELSYTAKKEALKANIRKSKQTAPLFSFGMGGGVKSNLKQRSSNGEGVIHLPRTNYGSMDRMFGIGTNPKPTRQTKQKSSGWGNMDKMLGL